MKPLWRISVATTLEAEDAVAELLGKIVGQTAASYFDVASKASIISVYSSKKILTHKVREELLNGLERIRNCGLKIGSGKIVMVKIRREDWAQSWKRHFPPVEIGEALLVKPSWIKKRPRKNQAVVILDPGLSFGTGQHPTTSFCLAEIAKRQDDLRPQSFLDIGSGSGILAIAAAKLGYQPVRAFDFDAESVRIAKANARKNGVAEKIEIARGNVAQLSLQPKKQYDLICANLISNLLMAESRKIAAQLNHRGALVLAGILKSEFSEVQKQFEALDLKLVSGKSEKEWRSGAFGFV